MASRHDGRPADRGDGQVAAIPWRLNAWTMPIKARIVMLSTGIRTPVGVKVLGTDLAEMERLARQIEAVIRTVPGSTSAYAERVIGGYYLNVDRDGARRRTGDDDGRRPRALYREHPLSARLPQRPAGDRNRGADPTPRRRH